MVLDTNTVLDLWAFRDARVQALRAQVEAGRLDWPATAGMRQELQAVLARGVAAGHGARADEVLGMWDRHARVVEPTAPLPTQHRLRCRDADDQPFIDLALELKAQWLLTSDRDLLSLARRAATLGLQIRSPHGWTDAALLGSAAQG